jgi:hypothetical protein
MAYYVSSLVPYAIRNTHYAPLPRSEIDLWPVDPHDDNRFGNWELFSRPERARTFENGCLQ